MEWLMETIDAHWLGAILIDGGRGRVRFSIQLFTQRNSFACNFRKREIFKSFVIFMDIVDGRIFSCMAVMSQASQKTPGYSLLLCLRYARSSFIITLDSETKNQKSPPPEWPYSTNWNAQPFTPSSPHSAETTWALIKITISVQTI